MPSVIPKQTKEATKPRALGNNTMSDPLSVSGARGLHAKEWGSGLGRASEGGT